MLILFTFRIKTGNWEKNLKMGNIKGSFSFFLILLLKKLVIFPNSSKNP